MPKPTCVRCETNDSLLWRNQESGQICNECYLAATSTRDDTKAERSSEEARDDDESRHEEPARVTGRGIRKSTRATRYKPPPGPARAPAAPARAPGGPRGRRSAFKRTPLRAPTATATLVTSDSIFYKGMYMQVGDIVSMVDVDGGTFYAQIRGFLTDQYCEKSAVVTWLLPTRASPPPEKCFDPATYIIGDSGYAQRSYLMTPVPNTEEGYYNKMHATARNTVERAIGRLKGRFRCLLVHRVPHYHPDKVAKVVIACCVLHNICNRAGLPAPTLDHRDDEREASFRAAARSRARDATPGTQSEIFIGQSSREDLINSLWRARNLH